MLLAVSGIKKLYGIDEVLTSVSFRLDRKEKVALVGRNGTGKTTLLKIITGQLEPDAGSVQLARGAKVGYLRQEAPVTSGNSVLEEAQAAVQQTLHMRARLQELEAKLEDSPTDDDLEEYALLHEHFLEAEGYSVETDVRVVLQRMGFTEDEFEKPATALSGGEKTRLALARLLLEEPDLLILDEPTNHLDLQATEWLENWIRGYHGAILLVSHDRTFLENTAERVIEMRDGEVKTYPGPFQKFLQLRAEEDARQAEVARRQEQQIAKLDEYVRRFMNSQRTAQARGRLKMMNRLIESKVSAPKGDKGMKAGFAAAKRSGDTVLQCERLTMGFGSETLFRDLEWTVRYGERWGVIGENGAGKSTLIRIALGLIDPISGRARLGSNVTAGYFSQDTSDLDPEMSPLDVMVWDCDMEPPAARNLLGRFLFSGEDVYRPVKTLSGGEKNKLALARLTVAQPNLLVLDEPTNHLDMASREALGEVLKEYNGTLILVSHDRWLLGQVTDHTLDLRRQGPLIFPGSYDEYRARQARPQPVATPTKTTPKAEAPTPAMSPRELSKEIERVTKLVSQIEDQVAKEERSIQELELKLANLPPDADVFALTREHQQRQEALEGVMASWTEQSERLEELQRMRG